MKKYLSLLFALFAASAAYGQCTSITDFSGGSAGAPATVANLTTSTHGVLGNFFWDISSNQSSSGGITFSAAAHGPLAWTQTLCSGATYVDSSSFGLSYNSGSVGLTYVLFNYPTNQGTLNQATTGAWISTNLPQGGSANIDMGPTVQGNSGGFNNVILANNGAILGITCETTPGSACALVDGSGNSINRIPVQSNFSRVWVTTEYYRSAGGGAYNAKVYAESTVIPGTVGTLLGGWTADPGSGASVPAYTYMGDAIGNSTPGGFEWRFDHFITCFSTNRSCAWPLLPAASVPLLSAGIIAMPRAADWTQAGIAGSNTGTLPDASWTQCGTTLAAGSYAGSTIETTWAACPANTIYKLGAGTFNITGDIHAPTAGHRAISGAGANSTFINGSSAAACHGQISGVFCLDSSDTNYTQQLGVVCNWTAGYTQGSNSITLSGCTGAGISAISTTNPTLLFLDQADTGFTGNGIPTGTATDNGNLYVCGDQYNATGPHGCSIDGPDGGGMRPERDQIEIHTASAVNTGTGVVTLAQPLILPNWASGQSPQVWITQPVSTVGVENMSIDVSASGAQLGCISTINNYNNWISGVKCTNNKRAAFNLFQFAFGIVQNSYIYKSTGTLPSNYGLRVSTSSGNVFQNNIAQQIQGGSFFMDGASSGNVWAYNFDRGSFQPGNNFMTASMTEHSGDYFDLFEGNIGNQITCDDIHATCGMVTLYRNFLTGWESQPSNPINAATNAIAHFNFGRYTNNIGNALGTPSYHTGYTSVSGSHDVYNMGTGGGPVPNEGSPFLTRTTALIWGSYDSFTAATRWCGNSSDTGWATTCASASEVPTGAPVYPNSVPTLGDTASGQSPMPASFYLSSKPSWFGTLTFPPIGPDVTSGNVSQCSGTLNVSGQFNGLPTLSNAQCGNHGVTTAWGGHVNANPAMNCALNIMGMPLDGTGGALAFLPDVCYAGGTPPSSVTLTPTSVNYGIIAQSTSSSGVGLTLSNPSGGTITITGISILAGLGTPSNDFTQTNTCAGTLANGGSCVITVTFRPTGGIGLAEAGSLSVLYTGATGSPLVTTLSGTSGPTAAVATSGVFASNVILNGKVIIK